MFAAVLKVPGKADTAALNQALSAFGPPEEVLFSAYSIDMRRNDFRVLNPKKWLRDEVVNVFMELIKDRHVARQQQREEWRGKWETRGYCKPRSL